MEKERLFYVDIIKLVSALMVMLFHFNVNAYYRDNNVELLGALSYMNISFGDIAISLFIIISGMTLSLTSREKFSTQRFLKKRALAIYPSFWISYLFVAFCIVILTNNSIGDGHLWKLILTFFGLDGFFLYKMTSYYLVGEWYTGYMLITYLFFPILFLYGARAPFYTMAFLLAIAIYLHINYSYYFSVYETCNPLMRLPDFFFGIMFGIHIRKDPSLLNKLFLLSVAYLVSYDYISSIIPYHFFMMFGGMAIFIVAVRVIDFLRVENTFIAKPIKYIAQFQFLAFLVHHQIILYLYSKIMVSELGFYEKVFVYLLVVFLSFLYAILINPVVRKSTFVMSGALDVLFKPKNISSSPLK
ncbi:conserved membrane hypothetical protein [Vibrio chagasii]|nr:conserved membrane hypothetical protein [Vibrio chagasii]CAH6942990.1 conserved membrane hypothetical protein [Vibrio chagasii]CAH7396822.1 conserved membrane hypothetical protein [Vibrio chagasii]CAH7416963.1 conserved membrane hypothetical protein [Vibrio chagasii]CAH7423232.1 conserved membrane hypothetical protein [Vibrio chagasii]